jgi:hypothetical protein
MSDPAATTDEALASAAVYTPRVLAIYDVFVLGVVSGAIWRCSRRQMRRLYDRNLGERHLDLGPSTGFFLDRARFPAARPQLTLVDLNANALDVAARRLRRYRPATVHADVLQPLDLGAARFDSIGLNFLLHCLPGGMARKATVFDHVRPYAAPGARIFGTTVLSGGVRQTGLSRRLIGQFNEEGTFHNADDSLAGLDAELRARFTDYRLTPRGSAAMFEIQL